MSALNALLGSAHVQPNALFSSVESRTLLLPDDILVHLQEDENTEEILIYSIPGSLGPVDWLAGQTEPWINRRAHPDHSEAVSVLTIDPATRKLLLIEVWPRAALDASTLAQRLDAYREMHQTWRSLLAPTSPIDGFESSQPFSAASFFALS